MPLGFVIEVQNLDVRCSSPVRTFRFTMLADNLTLLRLLFSSSLYSLNSKRSKWLGLLKSFVHVWFQFMFGFIVVACTD